MKLAGELAVSYVTPFRIEGHLHSARRGSSASSSATAAANPELSAVRAAPGWDLETPRNACDETLVKNA